MKANSATRFSVGVGSGERGRHLDRIAALEAENVALRGVETTARDFMAYCRAREALWATFGQCDDDGHIGHTEDTCPAWGAVTSGTMNDGDPAPIFAALAALDATREETL